MKRAHLVGSILILATILLAGCMRVQTLTVAPLTSILEAGETLAFTATDQLGDPVAVTWAVAAGPGTIDVDGLYTAPAAVAEVTTATITATHATVATMVGSSVVTLVPPETAKLVDASGDTFGAGTQYDVHSVETERTSTTMTITVTFDAATPPDLPAAGAIVVNGELSGFIDFDLDQSVATGFDSSNATYCPCTPVSAIGSDLFISFFERNAAGNYDVISSATLADVGDAVPSVAGSVLTLTIPLADLGGDDGVTNLSAVFGEFLGPTDCVPDEGAAVTTSIKPMITVVLEEPIHENYLKAMYNGFEWGVQTEPITLP